MFDISTFYDELLPWFMLFIASLGIFIWRYLGLILSSKIRKDSFFAKWINAVAFAMTTGLMVRIIFFPTGALAEAELLERLIPFLIGVIIFLFFSRTPIIGLIAGVLAFSSTVIYNQII